ncbi:hypothetical protein [Rhodococcus sp. USK10]|nr:hypothetical protein [Rhodococcus sp. USK10]
MLRYLLEAVLVLAGVSRNGGYICLDDAAASGSTSESSAAPIN